MSLQLVYTSAERLLEPGMSGYGVVARSEKMSLPLAKKIARLSNFKDFQRIAGPQYSYRIIDCAGQTYHILSCIQEAGSDYTGRNCHIAHHLALPKDLVRNLRQHQSRPTPAGIMLSLAKSGFWLKSWTGEPTRQLAEAYLSAESLPETSMQKTWLKWTAHKSNARAFSTPPYEHDCLITVPDDINPKDILKLINESDWLDHYRGWGKTFTTHGEAKDTFADTQRIFVVDGDTMEERAKRTGRPILRIHAECHLPVPESIVILDEQPQADPSDEEREAALFAKPAPLNEEFSSSPIPSPPPAEEIQETEAEKASTSPTGRKAQRRRRRYMWLLPAAMLVILASTATLMIQNLQTPAPEGEMAHHPRDSRHLRGKDSGRHLDRGAPNQLTARIAPPHEEQGNQPSVSLSKTPIAHEQHSQEFIEQHATLSGDILPTALRKLLRRAPALIEQGAIRIGCLDGNSLSIPLRKGSQTLLIEEIADAEYRLTLIKDGEKKQGLELILRASGRFQSFTMNGQEAYLLLEIQDQEEEQLILLIPRYQKRVQLPHVKLDKPLNIVISPKDITFISSVQNPLAMRMTLTESYLQQCPKMEMEPTITQADTLSLTLPQIKRFGENLCIQSNESDDTNGIYHWNCQESNSQNTSVDFYRYRIEGRQDLSKLILAHFDKLCNRPCANQAHITDSFYSIATLYHLLDEFERDSSERTHQALTARYCKLYAQVPFARLLQKIIPEDMGITLSPSESSLQSEECILKRQKVSHKLQNPAIRAIIKENVCHFISQELQQSITEAIKARQGQERQVELHKAHAVNGKAIWTFQIK